MAERKWSNYRLAKESDLSESTVTNIFKRHYSPSLATLESMCKAFGITMAQFFSDGTEPVELTDEQRQLFNKWNALNDEQKRVLFSLFNIL